jgi:SAM-dependent MidA family methyltransferase
LVAAPVPLRIFAQTLPAEIREAPSDAVFEWRDNPAVFEIGRRLARHGGAALVIDYGHAQSEYGDTLQAVSHHAFADPLRKPGVVDLTAHVDFEALAAAADSIGAKVHGPVSQQEFLLQLGIERRAEMLKAKASPEQAQAIDSALDRLIVGGPDSMGRLFKVMALAHPALGALPGFETEDDGETA